MSRRGIDAGQIKNGRRDIRDPGKRAGPLVLQGQGFAGDNQGHAHAALAGVKLVVGQRPDRRTGEARSDGVETALESQGVVVVIVVAVTQRQSHQQTAHIIPAAGLGAIVGGEDENRILIAPDILQVLHEPPEVVVHGSHHARVHRHALGVVAPHLGRVRFPVVGGRHAHHVRVRRHNAQLPGPVPTPFAQDVPAGVVYTHVLVGELLGRLHRNMHRLEGQIGKKRLPVGTV